MSEEREHITTTEPAEDQREPGDCTTGEAWPEIKIGSSEDCTRLPGDGSNNQDNG